MCCMEDSDVDGSAAELTTSKITEAELRGAVRRVGESERTAPPLCKRPGRTRPARPAAGGQPLERERVRATFEAETTG